MTTSLPCAQLLRDLDRGVHGRSAGAADQQALLAGHAPGRQERVLVGHGHPLVDDVLVEGLRVEVLADALDEVRVHVLLAGRVDRALGVCADDDHVRLLLLQVAARARDRAAGSDRDHERVDLAARLLPDLGAGRLVVGLRVALVRVLVGLVGAGDLLGEPVGDRVVALRRLGRDRVRADHDLGSVGAQERDLLLAHLVGHDEDAVVALDRGGDREADSGVPGRGLDDRPAGLQLPFALGLLDQLDADPVLDRPAGADVLELGEHGRGVVGNDALEPRERRVADEVENGRVLARHAPKA